MTTFAKLPCSSAEPRFTSTNYPAFMRVIQTTFGVFHHFELARELLHRGHLDRIYSTFPWKRLKREEIPRNLVRTYPWVHTPEMLSRRFGFEPPWLLNAIGYANALTFDRFVMNDLRKHPSPDALIALSGSSLQAGRQIQQRGGIFICDRGSSHQRYQQVLLEEEHSRWPVARLKPDSRDILREEEIYHTADAITVPSSFAARSFHAMGIPKQKVHILPYGVRLEHFMKTKSAPDDRFEVLFAGSVGLRKGFPYLLQAFAALRHPRKRLRVAGAIQTDVKSLLAQLPQSGVEYLGPVPQAQLIELMNTSHLMVLPSIEEGLALVQGQALACGCPVLATTNTGSEDLFTDGVEGFIVPIRDVAILTDRMQRLADDPALQRQMSHAALERVRHLGGWNDYGDKWEQLLYTLCAVPPPTK